MVVIPRKRLYNRAFLISYLVLIPLIVIMYNWGIFAFLTVTPIIYITIIVITKKIQESNTTIIEDIIKDYYHISCFIIECCHGFRNWHYLDLLFTDIKEREEKAKPIEELNEVLEHLKKINKDFVVFMGTLYQDYIRFFRYDGVYILAPKDFISSLKDKEMSGYTCINGYVVKCKKMICDTFVCIGKYNGNEVLVSVFNRSDYDQLDSIFNNSKLGSPCVEGKNQKKEIEETKESKV